MPHCRNCKGSRSDDHFRPELDQFLCKLWHEECVTSAVAIVDPDVAAVGPTELLKALAEGGDQ